MRNLWLIFLAGVSLAGGIRAADKIVDFSGTWLLDPVHSKSTLTRPELPKISGSSSVGGVSVSIDDTDKGKNRGHAQLPVERMENLVLLIVQTAGEVQTKRRFTIDGKEKVVPQKFMLDGSQCINIASDGRGGFVSRSMLKKGKLINSGTQTITMQERRTEIFVKEEYSLSKDGKKLTIKTMCTTPQGVINYKQVFIRQ